MVEIDVRNQPIYNHGVPRNKRQVGDRQLVPNQVLLFRENALEYPEDPLDLVVVPLDRARNLLSVEVMEPRCLTEVRTVSSCQIMLLVPPKIHVPLTRNLEGKPLELEVLFLTGARQFMVLIVMVNQVLQNRESLPGFRSVTFQWI